MVWNISPFAGMEETQGGLGKSRRGKRDHAVVTACDLDHEHRSLSTSSVTSGMLSFHVSKMSHQRRRACPTSQGVVRVRVNL